MFRNAFVLVIRQFFPLVLSASQPLKLRRIVTHYVYYEQRIFSCIEVRLVAVEAVCLSIRKIEQKPSRLSAGGALTIDWHKNQLRSVKFRRWSVIEFSKKMLVECLVRSNVKTGLTAGKAPNSLFTCGRNLQYKQVNIARKGFLYPARFCSRTLRVSSLSSFSCLARKWQLSD